MSAIDPLPNPSVKRDFRVSVHLSDQRHHFMYRLLADIPQKRRASVVKEWSLIGSVIRPRELQLHAITQGRLLDRLAAGADEAACLSAESVMQALTEVITHGDSARRDSGPGLKIGLFFSQDSDPRLFALLSPLDQDERSAHVIQWATVGSRISQPLSLSISNTAGSAAVAQRSPDLDVRTGPAQTAHNLQSPGLSSEPLPITTVEERPTRGDPPVANSTAFPKPHDKQTTSESGAGVVYLQAQGQEEEIPPVVEDDEFSLG